MPGSTKVKTTVPDRHSAVSLLGTRDELLKLVEGAFDVDILVRGSEITVTGDEAETRKVVHLFDELYALLDRGHGLDEANVAATIAMVQGAEHPHPSEVLSDEALTHRGRAIRPKTVGQKTYLDAIRANTVVFGIGPAGTGKTYLAMAMAVLALKRKEVSRIILTRPAVEAGERLGFLPGTLFEKIDPYLRPLFDALHDMMDAEQIAVLMERGTIEVAPLAFMRGRAQPVSTPVATPTGFRSIGDLRPGDLVIGSDGRPTPVLGVFPQGRKPVFRVRTQDGAETLCCGEHLWAVTTPADRRRSRPPRVLETQQMIGRLRTAHQHRFEVPLVQPVQFDAREVPADPYEVGLRLGTAAAARTARIEPVGATRRHVAPATQSPTLLMERDSFPHGLPDEYRYNAADVRLALLQGVLDAAGSAVADRRGSRIECTTSRPLRDDVVFLVRSLGGIATWRAAGGAPRSDVERDVVDIQVPQHLAPFRLAHKLAPYRRDGGGRPMRFIDSIEPAGDAETVCISVAASDSLYVTEDFLVTHNTLNDSFIVLDEAQNTTGEQMKMFLTRLGFGSRVVVTGDVTQTDLPAGRRSGLREVRDILQDIEGVAFVQLTGRDVVRHRIVQRIVEAYDAYDEARDDARDAARGERD